MCSFFSLVYLSHAGFSTFPTGIHNKGAQNNDKTKTTKNARAKQNSQWVAGGGSGGGEGKGKGGERRRRQSFHITSTPAIKLQIIPEKKYLA